MKKLAYLLKTSKTLYNIYYYLVSAMLQFLGMFIKVDDKLILFNSYGGKKYDDSPKAIFEEMIKDERFKDYRLVWALQNPESSEVPDGTEVIKCDTFKYFCTALKARVWVTNSSMERGLKFKKKDTFCLNTWHGTTIKKMGIDIQEGNTSFKGNNLVCADVMLAQSQYDIDVFSHAFQLPIENFRMIGLPRNDVLVNYSNDAVLQIRERLGIPQEKKILLYAPTFREFTRGTNREVILDIPMEVEKWKKRLGSDYVILFRAHYEVAKCMNICDGSFFIDVSTYPNLNDLMIISDGLISDYSSIFFDYSIMHKPMYCFAYDYEEYIANRGMYLDLKEALPCEMHVTEDSLLDEIVSGCSAEKRSQMIAFQERYVSVCGEAAKKSCDVIFNEIN